MRPRSELETVERWGGEGGEDAEAELEELIRVMVRREPDGIAFSTKLRRDEFVCKSCHMVQHQSRLADVRRMTCSDCVRTAARRHR